MLSIIVIVHLPIFFSPSRPFPTEESINDEDIYKGLPDLIEYVEHFSTIKSVPIFVSVMSISCGCSVGSLQGNVARCD